MQRSGLVYKYNPAACLLYALARSLLPLVVAVGRIGLGYGIGKTQSTHGQGCGLICDVAFGQLKREAASRLNNNNTNQRFFCCCWLCGEGERGGGAVTSFFVRHVRGSRIAHVGNFHDSPCVFSHRGLFHARPLFPVSVLFLSLCFVYAHTHTPTRTRTRARSQHAAYSLGGVANSGSTSGQRNFYTTVLVRPARGFWCFPVFFAFCFCVLAQSYI